MREKERESTGENKKKVKIYIKKMNVHIFGNAAKCCTYFVVNGNGMQPPILFLILQKRKNKHTYHLITISYSF